MQRFTGSIGQKINLGFMYLIALGALYFPLFPLNHSHEPFLLFGRAFMGLMAGGFLVFTGYGLLEALAVYEVDSDGITRRAWNGTRQMRWHDLTRYEMAGQRDSTVQLTDMAGNRLSIALSLLSSEQRTILSALLNERLAPLHERRLRDVGVIDTVYRPRRQAAWAFLIVLIMSGLAMAVFFAMPASPKEAGSAVMKNIVLSLFGAGMLFSLYYAIAFFTHSLTVTSDSLTERSIFRTRSVPFHHVTAVVTRMVQTKNGSFEQAIVEGDGLKLTFTSQMKDYGLLLDYIRQHVDTAAKSAGEAKSQELESKQQRQMRIARPIVASLYFLIFIGMGIWYLKSGNAHMEHYLLLDAQGRTARGHILGTGRQSGGKHTIYLIQYAFDDANGEHRESASPVSYADYQSAQVGAPVRVTYLPGRKDICMIAQSIGRKTAEGDIKIGYMNIVLAFVVAILLCVVPLRKTKAAA